MAGKKERDMRDAHGQRESEEGLVQIESKGRMRRDLPSQRQPQTQTQQTERLEKSRADGKRSERERERETDRRTDRQRDREGDGERERDREQEREEKRRDVPMAMDQRDTKEERLCAFVPRALSRVQCAVRGKAGCLNRLEGSSSQVATTRQN